MTFDNTKPADNRDWDLAAGDIRANWDAMETIWGEGLINASAAEWIDVTNSAYGAVGDGVTDDAAAINLALDAVTSPGDVVYFPPGKTYLIGSTLFVSSNTIMYGYGATLQRDFDSGAPSGTIRNKNLASSDANIKIYGFTMTLTDLTKTGNQIVLDQVDGVILKDINATGYKDWCFRLSIDDAQIDSCTIRTTEDASGTGKFGDGLHIYGGDDITVSNCIIESEDDCISIGSEQGIKDISNVTVTNCVLRPLGSTGIKLYTAETHTRDATTTGVVISNIVIDHSRVASTGGNSIFIFDNRTEAGFGASAKISNVSISNVYVDATRGAGQSVIVNGIPSDVTSGAITEKRVQNVTLSNVTVTNADAEYLIVKGVDEFEANNFRGFAARSSERGVTVLACDDVAFNGGIIKDAGNHAIRFDDGGWETSNNCSMSGVAIVDPAAFCIAPGDVDGLTVTGCTLEGGTFGLVEESTTLNSTYTGNVFTGQSSAAFSSLNTTSLMYGNSGAAPSNGLMSRSLLVDLNTTNKTTLFTVPAGMTFIATKVVIHSLSSATALHTSYDFGDGANADTWKTGVNLSTVDGTDDYFIITNNDTRIESTFASTGTFGVKPGAAVNVTATIDVFGYLF
jgi:polygalacturonase